MVDVRERNLERHVTRARVVVSEVVENFLQCLTVARVRGLAVVAGGQPTLVLTGGALARLERMVPKGMVAKIELTLTDEPPLASAFVIISAELAPTP